MAYPQQNDSYLVRWLLHLCRVAGNLEMT